MLVFAALENERAGRLIKAYIFSAYVKTLDGYFDNDPELKEIYEAFKDDVK